MGISIEAVATSLPHGQLFGRGALHLSDAAARDCLERGHHRAAELDMIVNVGIYKDHGIAEPALASMIQEDIGANPGHPPHPGEHGTFSFDLLAGSNGVVTAAYVLDGFVASATAKLALIVAGDSPPSPVVRVPFAPAAGAILLSHTPDEVGFARFVFETFAEDAGLFEVRARWDPHAGVLRRGGNVLEIYEAPAFRARCIEHGIAVSRRLLDEARVDRSEVDVLVANQLPSGFADELALGLGLPQGSVPRVATELAHAHTAGPIAALEEGLRRKPRTILFVTAGAGITVCAALYRDRRAA